MYGGVTSTEYVQSGKNMSAELSGRDRFKFFRRPVVPSIEGSTQTPIALATKPTIQRSLQPRSQVLQAQQDPRPRTLEKLGTVNRANAAPPQAQQQSLRSAVGAEAKDADPLKDLNLPTREMGCQTMYRENDCQTDPYSPDYFVDEGQQPEVLAIMDLRYGEGLPAALAEVEVIDRVQRRKMVEANLPQGGDEASMQERLRQLETLERTEWEEREAHIKNLQEARLQQVEKALKRREQQREELSAKRIQSIREEKLMQAEQKLKSFQDKRLTVTRKLTARHTNPCCERSTRDIIEAHVKHGNKAKPVTNNTLVGSVNTANYDVRPTLLTFPEGVQELEKHTVPKLEKVKTRDLQPPEDPAIKELTTNFQKRKARGVREDLDYADSVIEKSKETTAKAASIQDLYRATPRLQRPDTPTLVLQGDEQEEREEAMLLLQRLLRGRAVQNDFFDGKERCHGLIEELQAATKAQDGKCFWQPDKLREQEFARQEAMVQSVVDGVVGDVAFGTIDYLFKELLRQKETAKVDQLRVWAQSTRSEREAAEADRREAEALLRRKEEFQYAALTRSVDSTIESYLNQLLTASTKTTARDQALQEEYHKMSVPEDPNDPIAKEEYVCELLDKFVVPEVAQLIETKGEHRSAVAVAEVATHVADDLSQATSK